MNYLWTLVCWYEFRNFYPHAASQYHIQPNAKCGVVMLSVDEFPFPRKQTKGNVFISCSHDVCYIIKCFRSFKTQLSCLKHHINSVLLGRIAVASEIDAGCDHCMIAIVTSPWHSFHLTLMTLNIEYVYSSWLLANQKRKSALIMGLK